MPNLSKICALGLIAALLAACAPEREAPASAALPDWSGVWALYEGWIASADAYAGTPKLTTEYAAIRAQAYKERRQANLSTCLPAGATAVLQHATLFEVLFNPGRVTLLFEDGEVRRIYTDGRAHRPLAELRDSFMGDSIGHWEADTLVVDTIGFPYGELWQNYGVRATINTHLVERIRLLPDGSLEIANVMTDPAIFAEPYAYTRIYHRSPLPLDEPGCLQNNRDDGSNVDITPPEE